MKLMTKEIEKQLAKYPLYSQGGKGKDATVVAKFFLPIGYWTWYIMEAEGDTLFGICVSGKEQAEYGYFSLKELEELRVTKFRFGVERDIYFKPTKLKDIDDPNIRMFV